MKFDNGSYKVEDCTNLIDDRIEPGKVYIGFEIGTFDFLTVKIYENGQESGITVRTTKDETDQAVLEWGTATANVSLNLINNFWTGLLEISRNGDEFKSNVFFPDVKGFPVINTETYVQIATVEYTPDALPPDTDIALINEEISARDAGADAALVPEVALLASKVKAFENGWSIYWTKSETEVTFSVRYFTEGTPAERFLVTFTPANENEVPVLAKIRGSDQDIVPHVIDAEDNMVRVQLRVDLSEGAGISGRVVIVFKCGKVNGNIVFGDTVIVRRTGFVMNAEYATSPGVFNTPCSNLGGPLTISVSQDAFGNELGEIAAVITSGTNYDWQTYPQEDVGANTSIGLPLVAVGDYLNLFSFRPDLRSVLQGNSRAKTLYGQVKSINNTQLTDGEFFNRILIYSAARFILSGLLYGEFKAEWLLREFYYKFVVDLSMDENLSIYAQFFTSKACQYSDYHEYFKGGQVCFPCQGS
jgi:hypothetical protein